MDISYIYHTDWDPSHSHGMQIIHTINGISQQGHAISLFTPASLSEFLQENKVELHAAVKTLPTAQVKEHAGKLEYYAGKYVDQFTYYAFATLASMRQDLIFTRDFRYLKFLQYVPTSLYPPVLYEAHQCYSGYDEFSQRDEYLRLQQADRIITQSPGVAKDLGSLGIEVAEVIPNAAPQDFVPAMSQNELRDQYGFDQESTVIIYAGSFSQWKNDLELVVDAVDKLGNTNSNVEIAFVGGTDKEVKDLTEYCKENLCNVPYHLFGRVPHRSVFGFLKAADIGVIPLRGTNREATEYTSPIKLFEYMVSGLQVVSADVPSINRLHDPSDSIYTYTPGDPTAFSNAIQSAMDAKMSSVDRDRHTYKARGEQLHDHIQAIAE